MFLSSSESSAIVVFVPLIKKIGSYPKPLCPEGFFPILPLQIPRQANSTLPSGLTRVIAQTNSASLSEIPSISLKTRSILFAGVSAYLAECIPGFPPSAFMQSPESSASVHVLEIFHASSALILEFSSKVSPSSIGSNPSH